MKVDDMKHKCIRMSLSAVAAVWLLSANAVGFRLHNVFTDHMVFQRNAPIVLTGTASPGLKVVAEMRRDGSDPATWELGDTYADSNGEWRAELPAQAAGGPYTIVVRTPVGSVMATKSTALTLRDVYVGELWLASGQSNMEFPVWCTENPFFRLDGGDRIAAAADDPLIRVFNVPNAVSPDAPCREVSGDARWLPAVGFTNVAPVSAVAYYFARQLREHLQVPVGIVSSAWGGTRIESWIPKSHLEAAGLSDEMRKKSLAAAYAGPAYESTITCGMPFERRVRILEEWMAKVRACKVDEPWRKSSGRCLLSDEVGVTECKYEIEFTGGEREAAFHADVVRDTDEVFLDGVKIGETGVRTNGYWKTPRDYAIPAKLVTKGRHELLIRVFTHVRCGFLSTPSIRYAGGTNDLGRTTYLARRTAVPTPDLVKRPTSPYDVYTEFCMRNSMHPRFSRDVPSTLCNAMLAPFRDQRFRGMIWYQGCSNARTDEDVARYGRQQLELVKGIREGFGLPEMAFVAVKLAGFHKHCPYARLADGFWKSLPAGGTNRTALIRQQQDLVRELPFAATASAVDLGDHSDIHPRNKAEVARRLWAQAENLVYGGANAAYGPEPASAVREGSALRLVFVPASLKGGLVVKGGAFGPHEFQVCGADGRWAWATATRDGDTVVVTSPEVAAPVRVRYAFEDYPAEMSLWNGEGFPSHPFERTVR